MRFESDRQTASRTEPTQALAGLRVLDFSHALAGPYCTLLLADYGAEIYKLEPPEGELARGWGPPFVEGEASFFLGLNRGKRGVSIDLKRHEGVDLCLRLVERMDVLIENFRPGTMQRLGLGYEAVRNRNPRLIYCSISGYGQKGPSRDQTAMDLTIECSSGFMSITGTDQGEQVRSGYAVADINAGLFAAIGILMALQQRDRTGIGQYVDVSMFDGMTSAMSSNYMAYLGSGNVPKPMGTSFPTLVPYRTFRASDREFSIAVGSEKLWATLCDVIDRPEFRDDPRYSSNALRIQNREALERQLQHVFSHHTANEWVKLLGNAGVPCTTVATFAEVVDDPQAALRQMFPSISHPVRKPYRATGPPIKMSESVAGALTGAPQVGEHTEAVLTELLGMDLKTVKKLAAHGVIVLHQRNCRES